MAHPPLAYADQPVFRLSVAQYRDMIRAGTLTTEDPVEPIEGLLAHHRSHAPARMGSVEAARL